MAAVGDELDHLDDEALEALCVLAGMCLFRWDDSDGTPPSDWYVTCQHDKHRFFFRLFDGITTTEQPHHTHKDKRTAMLAALRALARGEKPYVR